MIVKLEGGYFEWSSVVDAPLFAPLPLSDFEAYIRDEYGEEGMRRLPERMARVEAIGTSAYGYESAENLMTHNRFGPGESRMSMDDLRAWARSALASEGA